MNFDLSPVDSETEAHEKVNEHFPTNEIVRSWKFNVIPA